MSGTPSTPCCFEATARPNAMPARNERPASAAHAAATSHKVSQGSVKAVGANRIAKGDAARSTAAINAVRRS